LVVGKDTLIYADWRTHKVVVLKNNVTVSTCEVKFKDYYHKKGMLAWFTQKAVWCLTARSCT